MEQQEGWVVDSHLPFSRSDESIDDPVELDVGVTPKKYPFDLGRVGVLNSHGSVVVKIPRIRKDIDKLPVCKWWEKCRPRRHGLVFGDHLEYRPDLVLGAVGCRPSLQW